MREFRTFGPASHRALFILILLSTFLFLSPAFSQADRSGMIDRLNRMERDMQMMQRDYYRGTAEGKAPTGAAAPSGAVAAELNVSLNAIQEELRQLRGRIEEMEHQQQRVTERFESLERDMDARLGMLERNATSAAPATISPPVIGGNTDAQEPMVSVRDAESDEAPATKPATAASSGYQNSNEHYNAAFKLLNQGDYTQSAAEFESFTQQYPDDVLVGNAYYWLGETHYVRSQFEQAAEKFRSGFEAMPQGPKSPDNLLKLAMSLSALQRKDEACVVLSQLIKKHSDKSQVVKRKAEKERDKLGCR